MNGTNKKKIVNDPVHGFISISHPLIFDLIEHPYFQRLRNIKQLGLSYLVYPGAVHSRFQHCIGAMHLLDLAIETLRGKGLEITDREAEAAAVAILLHDIGHGPFSHALEHVIANDISHEHLSRCFLYQLNKEFDGKLSLAIDIFEDKYPRHFLHQLISGQLDMDRMDYLKRDSFFTGVSEGIIGTERIIKMLNVANDTLVVEAKGIYSIEKFLIARRLMYWQVYLHKTVVAAEQVLIKLLERAKELLSQDHDIACNGALLFLLKNRLTKADFFPNATGMEAPVPLQHFASIDDNDVMVAAKQWMHHSDKALSHLATMIVNRRLPSVELNSTGFDSLRLNRLVAEFKKQHVDLADFYNYFVFTDSISINAYSPGEEAIQILYNNGKLIDIAIASDMLNARALSDETKKFFICYPKQLRGI
ncbi:MAG: HD domain-containing protein [Bacteroidota bacterium]